MNKDHKVKNIVNNIDSLIINIIERYDISILLINEDWKNKLKNSLLEFYNSDELVEELINCISILVINDLDIGNAYYTKTKGEHTVEKIIVNEIKLRQANESRSKMKNLIDDLLLQLAGNSTSFKVNIRVTNIDSFSAYIDRLSTERIKEYYFRNYQNKITEAIHQNKIAKIIIQKIIELMNEIDTQQGYKYISEKRTFDEEKIIKDINNMLNELK